MQLLAELETAAGLADWPCFGLVLAKDSCPGALNLSVSLSPHDLFPPRAGSHVGVTMTRVLGRKKLRLHCCFLLHVHARDANLHPC